MRSPPAGFHPSNSNALACSRRPSRQHRPDQLDQRDKRLPINDNFHGRSPSANHPNSARYFTRSKRPKARERSTSHQPLIPSMNTPRSRSASVARWRISSPSMQPSAYDRFNASTYAMTARRPTSISSGGTSIVPTLPRFKFNSETRSRMRDDNTLAACVRSSNASSRQ